MIYVIYGLIGVGLLFSLLRLVKGPSLADRAVAVDTFNVIVIGIIALFALVDHNGMFLDIAIVYSILAFLETVVFARFLEGRHDS